MPITISEYVKSRRLIQSPGGEATFERIFTIQGTDDPAAAQDVGPQLGDVHAGTLVAIRRELEVLAARGEQGALRLTVQYVAARIRLDGPTPSFEWTTATTTKRRTTALAPQQHFPANDPGAAAPGDAIEVHAGRVEGVDVHVPVSSYRETHYRGDFSVAYRQTLRDLTGAVNLLVWRGWQAGEVLFAGAVARRRSGEPWQVTYSFLVAPAETVDVTFLAEPQTVPVQRGGWEHLWFSHGRTRTESGDDLVDGIRAAHVAQVYLLKDFALLGLGTEAIE